MQVLLRNSSVVRKKYYVYFSTVIIHNRIRLIIIEIIETLKLPYHNMCGRNWIMDYSFKICMLKIYTDVGEKLTFLEYLKFWECEDYDKFYHSTSFRQMQQVRASGHIILMFDIFSVLDCSWQFFLYITRGEIYETVSYLEIVLII